MFIALFMMSCCSCGDLYPVMHTSKDKDRMTWLAEISDLLYELEHDSWTHIWSESNQTDQYVCPICTENALRELEKSRQSHPF
jgi:hypothetical protein